MNWRKVIIQLESEFKQTMKYGSLELYVSEVAIDMNQHGNRQQTAVVKHLPKKFKWIKEGDTVWIHHSITTGHRNRLSVGSKNVTDNHNCVDRDNGLYTIGYDEYDGVGYNCLIYLVKDKDTEEFHTTNDFLFGVPNEDYTSESTSVGLWTPKRKDKGLPLESVIKYTNELGIEAGIPTDTVIGVVKHSDYVMDVEGQNMWRFRHKDVVYTRDGDEFTPVMNWLIFKADAPDTHTEAGLEIPESARKFKRTGVIQKVGERCYENAVGDSVMFLRESDVHRLYDDIFITREANIVPQAFIKSIRQWQHSVSQRT